MKFDTLKEIFALSLIAIILCLFFNIFISIKLESIVAFGAFIIALFALLNGMKISKKQIEQTTKSNFDNDFFSMLTLLRDMLNEIEVGGKKGAGGLKLFFLAMKEEREKCQEKQSSDCLFQQFEFEIKNKFFPIGKQKIFGDYKSLIEIYFKLFQFIEGANINSAEKEFYYNLIKSYHPWQMGALLYWEVVIKRNPEKYNKEHLKLIKDHRLLDVAEEGDFLQKEQIEYFKKILGG